MVELLFLPSVYTPCPACRGTRYNAKTLEVEYRGKNDRRRARADGGRGVGVPGRRAARPPVARRAAGRGPRLPAARPAGDRAVRRRGPADQAGDRAAAGRAGQRACTSWTSRRPGCTRRTWSGCWPSSTGWSRPGNTVVVVEHDLQVIAASDWVIDVGPGAGDEGGRVVAAGPPAEVAPAAGSRTAAVPGPRPGLAAGRRAKRSSGRRESLPRGFAVPRTAEPPAAQSRPAADSFSRSFIVSAQDCDPSSRSR